MGDFRTQHLLTSDETIAKVHAAKAAMTTSSMAQPNVAGEVFKMLLARSDTEHVTLDGFPVVQRDPTYGWPGMRDVEKGQLQKLVEKQRLTRTEVDEYSERLDVAVANGDWVETALVF